MPSHIRERVRRYLAAKQRAAPRLPRPGPFRLLFIRPERGTYAATGHARQMYFCDGRVNGPPTPYELSPEEDAERLRKLEERQIELLKRKVKGTVQ